MIAGVDVGLVDCLVASTSGSWIVGVDVTGPSLQVADRWDPRVNLTELNKRDEGAWSVCGILVSCLWHLVSAPHMLVAVGRKQLRTPTAWTQCPQNS